MDIPVRFTLFGSEYRVIFDDNLRTESSLEGTHNYYTKEITLQPEAKGQTRDAVEHAFFHELVHAILVQSGESELNQNEKFIDIFAGLLHQAMKTAKYKK